MGTLPKSVKTGLIVGACGIGLCAIARKMKLASRVATLAHSIEGVPFPGVNLYSFLASRQMQSLFAEIASEIGSTRRFDQILDLGTNVGLLPIEIARCVPDAHIVGIDRSQNMIQIAQTNARANQVGSKLEFSVGDPSRLPFPGRYFDLVVSVNALHHWSEPTLVFEEVYHVLKPGGEFWIYDYRSDVDEGIWKTAMSHLPVYLSAPFAVGPRASAESAFSDEQLMKYVARTHFVDPVIEKRSFTLFGQRLPIFNRLSMKKLDQVHDE